MSTHQYHRFCFEKQHRPLEEMFRLVVLFAVVAVAVAKPGYLHGGLGYSAIATPVVAAVPAAVSHSYRYLKRIKKCGFIFKQSRDSCDFFLMQL